MSLKPKRKRLVKKSRPVKQEKFVKSRPLVPKPPKNGRTKKHDTTPKPGLDTTSPQQKIVSKPAKTGRNTRPDTPMKPDFDTILDAYRILGIRFASDQPSVDATEAIKHLALEQLTERFKPKSEVLRRVLLLIEPKIDGRPTWEKCFVMGGIECVWIAARRLVPGFKTAEDVLNAVAEKRYRKVLVGVVKVFVPDEGAVVDCISWLLSEDMDVQPKPSTQQRA